MILRFIINLFSLFSFFSSYVDATMNLTLLNMIPNMMHYGLSYCSYLNSTVDIDDLNFWFDTSKNFKVLTKENTGGNISSTTHNEQEILLRLLQYESQGYKTFFINCSFECTYRILFVVGHSTLMFTSDLQWIILYKGMTKMEVVPQHLYLACYHEHVSTHDEIEDDCKRSNLQLYTFEKYQWQLLKCTHHHHHITKCEDEEVLRIVTIPKNPHVMIAEYKGETFCKKGKKCLQYSDDGSEVSKCCYGLLIDFIKRVELELQIKSILYFVRDGYYGSLVNGTWNGMVYDLYTNKADVALATLSVTEIRMQVIEFTEIIFEEKMAILTTAEKILTFDIKLESPFKTQLWMMAFFTILLGSVALSILHLITIKRSKYHWVESISYVIGLFFGRNAGGDEPFVASARIVSICLASSFLVLISTYTAIMTADFYDHKMEPLIQGFRDKKLIDEESGVKFGLLESSAWETYFRNSSDKQLKALSDSPNKVKIKSSSEGYRRILAGEIQAVINEELMMNYFIGTQPKHHHYYVTDDRIKLFGVGFGVQKNSKWKIILSNFIRDAKESGFIEELKYKWHVTYQHISIIDVPIIDIHSFKHAFLWLFCGIGMALIIIFTELLWSKYT